MQECNRRQKINMVIIFNFHLQKLCGDQTLTACNKGLTVASSLSEKCIAQLLVKCWWSKPLCAVTDCPELACLDLDGGSLWCAGCSRTASGKSNDSFKQYGGCGGITYCPKACQVQPGQTPALYQAPLRCSPACPTAGQPPSRFHQFYDAKWPTHLSGTVEEYINQRFATAFRTLARHACDRVDKYTFVTSSKFNAKADSARISNTNLKKVRHLLLS